MSGALARAQRWRAALIIALFAGGVLLVNCVASPGPTSGPTTPSLATQPSPSALPSEGTQEPLNRLEVKIIDALARLGITGQRAEHGFISASIWAQFGTGSELFINALPTGTSRGEFTVIDERQLEGIRVQRVRYASDPPPRHRFDCSGDTYEVRGATPPGFQDMDAFVSRFIRALGCGA